MIIPERPSALECYILGPWRADIATSSTSLGGKSYRDRIRLRVIDHYTKGLRNCACCGQKGLQFLTIDHVNNDGHEHRKKVGVANLPIWLKNNNYPDGFQILCWNCNMAKARNKGICPHKDNNIKF